MDTDKHEFKDILAGGETLSIEFKSDLKGFPDRDLVATVVAMTNTDYTMSDATSVVLIMPESVWMYITLHRPSEEQLKDAIVLLKSQNDMIAFSGGNYPIGKINYTVRSEFIRCSSCGNKALDKINSEMERLLEHLQTMFN